MPVVVLVFLRKRNFLVVFSFAFAKIVNWGDPAPQGITVWGTGHPDFVLLSDDFLGLSAPVTCPGPFGTSFVEVPRD